MIRCRSETEPGLVICYGTMYGNTERIAEIIARAAKKGEAWEHRNVQHLEDSSQLHHATSSRYRGLIVGAPTYNAGLYHEMEFSSPACQ